MYSYYEVHDGFTLTVPSVGVEIEGSLMRLVEAAGMEDDLPEEAPERKFFFKKSEGWTREWMDKMLTVFNGSGI